MGLFDSIVSAVESEASSVVGNEASGGLTALINHPDVGGLSGFLQQLSQGGLGAEVASWVGNGGNLPVSASQLQQAIGNSPQLQALTSKLGIDPQAVAGQLSTLLPQLVNHLTPNGTVPATGDLTHEALAEVMGLFGK